ncbi:ABC transporter permease [Cohnella silvisoli]|uniref:ABC transporter permease subunit n=1 Tax=Cohnella silvisoli TaxID=2873699 RepID=A0ABV1L3F9_9BACL|nr:ABC transporter permease subunit [Cohnella silvisoli]MCD9025701.1 ABC transporter permease subunit [Cohnella silvisoli]
MRNRSESLIYHLMLLPGMLVLFLFSIIPMAGIVIAFQKFVPAKGVLHSAWVGMDNLAFMFQIPDSRQVFLNTIIIAAMKVVAGLAVPIIFALVLNELRSSWFKRTIQTIVYIPHFISWVILAGIITNLFSLDGIVNQLLSLFGVDPVMFLASNFWFRPILIGTDVWKEFGFGTIVYLAAIAGINPNLYEAAVIDGAGRFKQLMYITLPGVVPTIILLSTLSLGNILNAGFDQIFNLYNPLVYESSDIVDTYVFRVGLVEMQYGLATAVGLLKSIVAFLLIIISYMLARKLSNYRIF